MMAFFDIADFDFQLIKNPLFLLSNPQQSARRHTFSSLFPGQRIAARNKDLRSLIYQSPANRSTFDLAAAALAAVGRAEGTSKTYAREMSRLAKFASIHGFPTISGPAEISAFLSNEAHVISYIGYLANCGFTFTTAHKILFSLRAATTAQGVPEPPQFSRFIKLALKGYELVFVSAPPRPVISVPMFHFCARTSLADLFATSATVPSALQDPDMPLVRLARWRAMFSLGFFAALRSGEYTESALLSSCVVFDATSLPSLLSLKSANPPISLSSLWKATISALHPKATISVNIVVSKCNSKPEARLIGRDASDPSLCPVTAIAFWFVLGPVSAGDPPFFALRRPSGLIRGPSRGEVVAPLRFYLLASRLMDPASVRSANLHGLRHGGASGAVLGGATRAQTKCLGGWRGDSDAVYTSTTKGPQGLVAALAISRALAEVSATARS